MCAKDQNLSKTLDHIAQALVNLEKAIIDSEKESEFIKVKELEYASMMLKASQKTILYGLFHD
ncbi:hypothetical protein Q8G31_26365 [Priestia megaterium]|uniref:hypothetical protein n=1 Tax=Priestia megaterium TaxID=1404 RepID=UPI0027316081|nr:hypothetical protein [Priestia megaterium]MDP1383247.1 hypothetical protein [Priestia megaterium]MDP1427393.1 hypothetical protein [Priestia megaterium]